MKMPVMHGPMAPAWRGIEALSACAVKPARAGLWQRSQLTLRARKAGTPECAAWTRPPADPVPAAALLPNGREKVVGAFCARCGVAVSR